MSIFKDSLAATDTEEVYSDWRDYYPSWAAVGLIPLHPPAGNYTGKEPINPDWQTFIQQRIQLKESKNETFKDIEHELQRGRNVGLVIPPGVICLDYDNPDNARDLLQLYPDAPAQLTQSGGIHLFFKTLPGEEFKGAIKVQVDGLAFDIRAAGRNQVVCFPSTGLRGKYHWLRPLPADKVDLPLRPEGCLGALVSAQATTKSPNVAADVDFGAMPTMGAPTPEQIKQLKRIHPPLAQAIKDKEPIGSKGSRNADLLSAVGTCYAATFDYETPPSAKQVFRMLRGSVSAYQNPDPTNPPPTLTELWSMCCRVGVQELNKWVETRSIIGAVNYWFNVYISRRERHEQEVITEAANELGLTTEQLKKQAILYLPNGHQYYVFNEALGGYAGPVSNNGLLHRLSEGCKNLLEFNDVYNTTRQGDTVQRQVNFLLRDYGKPVTRVDRVAGQGLPTYNAETETMTVNVWELRELKPRHDPLIAEWLKLLGKDDHGFLLDWLATIHRTDRPNSCLYLKGPKAIGKSLLVDGLARLWGRKATRYRDVMARFNDSFLRSPLVHLDEGLSDKSDSLRFREFISENEHVIETKGQPQFTLTGCARCVVTSNNVNALKIHESLNTDDIEAISSRIMWVSTDEKPATFLRTIQGRETTDSWVQGDLIARHVLWLSQNREVKTDNHENRFLVPGVYHPEKLQMLREFRSNGSIFEVLANYVVECATTPKGQHYPKYAGIAFTQGTVAVNRKGLVEYWTGREKEFGDIPQPRDMKESLRIMSRDEQISKRTIYGPRRFDLIDYDVLMAEIDRMVPEIVVEQVEDFLNKSVDD